MRTINEIIIHCTATPAGREVTVATIDKWHRERGFKSIGYHFVIHLDGKVEVGRPIEQAGAHCLTHNEDSIGICYVGGTNAKGDPEDTRTNAQKQAIETLVRNLMKKYKLTQQQVYGHNEFAKKACPSFDVQAWKKEVGL
jgi:N-acetylmuramoyl-L-alanine amidase